MSRILAREAAFSALFQLDFNHGEIDEHEIYEEIAIDNAVETTEEIKEQGMLTKKNIRYVNETVKNIMAHLEQIDAIIKSNLKKNWTLSRLASVDRNILRLAVYELKFAEDKDSAGVIINEAVNLAKKYGTDDSGPFVNGVLSAISD